MSSHTSRAVCLGLLGLHCALLCRAMWSLCTTHKLCAPTKCVVHNDEQGDGAFKLGCSQNMKFVICKYKVRKIDLYTDGQFMVYNAHTRVKSRV